MNPDYEPWQFAFLEYLSETGAGEGKWEMPPAVQVDPDPLDTYEDRIDESADEREDRIRELLSQVDWDAEDANYFRSGYLACKQDVKTSLQMLLEDL